MSNIDYDELVQEAELKTSFTAFYELTRKLTKAVKQLRKDVKFLEECIDKLIKDAEAGEVAEKRAKTAENLNDWYKLRCEYLNGRIDELSKV